MHKRLPVFRAGQSRYDSAEKAKNSQPLDKIETDKGKKRDHDSDQSWTNEAAFSGCGDKQHKSKQRKSGLHKNAQRNVNHHGACSDRERGAMDRCQTRAHNVAADCGRGHQRADRLTKPTHPKKLEQRQAIRSREQHPPRNRIQKYRNEMVDNDA
ncbi:MAG: hypothetical protein Udaeo2_08220 [Candidatus Udaeobacter sp.]|nr:MAG: hypothetical protein Udaeo2_08220 [Candidatus Udaeobacter sp.]